MDRTELPPSAEDGPGAMPGSPALSLGGPSVELERVVVPSLVNDLATVGRRWCWYWTTSS